MNRNETLLILGTLQTAYPSFYRGQTKEQIEATVRLWTDMFSDTEYALVEGAVRAIIATRVESFPPTIGLVNEMIQKLTSPWLTPMEAWGLVRKAIRNGTYGSREEWEKLPEEVKATITPEQIRAWAMDDNFNESVVSSNFMRSFSVRAQENRDMKVISERVKTIRLGFVDRMALVEGTANRLSVKG